MLKKTCYACDKDRKKTKIVYDAAFKAYCSRPHECNEGHPNSVTNLIKNGKQQPLMDYDSAVKLFSQQNSGDTIRLLDAPITIRLTDTAQAQFITRRCAELNITTSELIRRLIDEAAAAIPIQAGPDQFDRAAGQQGSGPEEQGNRATGQQDDDLTF